MKYRIYKSLISFVLIFSSWSVFAQTNTTYFMSELPQSIRSNPAFQPTCRFFFNSYDVDLFVGQNGLSFDDAFTKSGNQYILDINKAYDNLPNQMDIMASTKVGLASFGFKTGKFYFSLFNTINVESSIGIPKSIFAIKDGTWNMEDYSPRELDFSGLGPTVFIYTDHRIAASYEFLPNLHFGAALHIYNGLFTLNTFKSDLSITTNPETFDLTFAADLEYRTNAQVDIVEDADGNVEEFNFDDGYYSDDPFKFIKPLNLGFGVDLGVVYNILPKIELAASVSNLGFINWDDAIIAKGKGTFTFSGIDFSEYITDSDMSLDSLAPEMIDSIINSVEYGIDTAQTFKTGMPTTINLSANYQLTKKLTVGAMTQTKFYSGRMYQSFTLSSNFHARLFNFGLTYSLMNKTYANIGFGFGLKLAAAQFYLVSDSWSQMASPYKLQFISLRTGVNIVLGCKKKIDVPMYNDEI